MIRGDSHKNNFGFLRLLFAYLVILSHSPELIDGNSSRELLHQLTDNLTFGVLAVDSFFIISGYLICQSFVHSTNLKSFLFKRILRIYPAFVAIWIISILLIVPLAGGWHLLNNLSIFDWARMIVKIFALSQPHVNDFLFVEHIKPLNGSMWTIRYEFMCYLIIPIIALIGLNKRNAVLILILSISLNIYTRVTGIDWVIQSPIPFSLFIFTRLLSAFMIGICFYQYRERLMWNNKISLFCFTLLTFCLFNPQFAELGLIIFGSYLLFNFAFNFNNSFIQKIGTENDISYGVYLHAWPVQGLFIQSFSNINPWILTVITICTVSITGYLSWIWIEKPFLLMKKRLNNQISTNK